MGVDPDHAGSTSFHAMFSVFDHRTGRFVSTLMPFSDGPRHCGQFSADNDGASERRRRRRESLISTYECSGFGIQASGFGLRASGFGLQRKQSVPGNPV